jgi:hypothetical protein
MRKLFSHYNLTTTATKRSKASKCKRKFSATAPKFSKLQDLAVIVQTGTQGEILAAFKADGILSVGLAAGSAKLKQ